MYRDDGVDKSIPQPLTVWDNKQYNFCPVLYVGKQKQKGSQIERIKRKKSQGNFSHI